MRQVVAIRHLQGKNDAGKRRPEYRRHTRSRTADQHDAAVPLGEAESLQVVSKPGPDPRVAVDAGALQRRAPPKPTVVIAANSFGKNGRMSIAPSCS